MEATLTSLMMEVTGEVEEERRNILLLQPKEILKIRNLVLVGRNGESKRMIRRVQMMCQVTKDSIKAVVLRTRNWARVK